MIEQLGRGHYKLIVSVTQDGVRTRRTRKVFCSGKREAQRLYNEFEEEVRSEIVCELTVDELLEWHIENLERNGIKATTKRAYECSKKAINSSLGERKADSLTLIDIDRFISLEAKIKSPKSIKNEMSLLSSAYKAAIRSGLLRKNPCEYAVIPKQVKPDIDTLTNETIKDFIAALDNTVIDFKVMCELALFCGMRRSEILGLLKTDIYDNAVHINKVRMHFNKQDIIQTPKTKSSDRVLSVPEFILEDIKKMQEEQKSRPRQSEYLIQNLWGDPPSSYWVDKRMSELIEQNDLPHITMHGLRHSYTSMLINEGIPIAEVSSELGHSSIDITLRTYTHLFKDVSTASKEISKLMENKFSKSSGTFSGTP